MEPYRHIRIAPGVWQLCFAIAMVCSLLWLAQQLTHYWLVSSNPSQLVDHSWFAPLQAVVLLFSV